MANEIIAVQAGSVGLAERSELVASAGFGEPIGLAGSTVPTEVAGMAGGTEVDHSWVVLCCHVASDGH